MNKQSLASDLGISVSQLNYFIDLSQEKLLSDKKYIQILENIDRELLETTLPDARAAYEKKLPAFAKNVAARYQLENAPMSAYTLGNWVVGVLQYPENIGHIIEMHGRVPGVAISDSIGELIQMLSDLPGKAGTEWKRALTALSLPLMKN